MHVCVYLLCMRAVKLREMQCNVTLEQSACILFLFIYLLWHVFECKIWVRTLVCLAKFGVPDTLALCQKSTIDLL